MQRSYRGLKDEGSDLKYCEDHTIVQFFEQMGLSEAWKFDETIEAFSKNIVDESSKQEQS